MSSSSKFKIKVAVRVRPLLGHDKKQESCVSATSSEVITCYDPEKLYPDGRLDYLRENRTRERQYDFDHVFGPKCDQREVYETLGSPLVPVVIAGYNATVFAYGQTGSGKTHTMLGTSTEPGLMGQTLIALFNSGSKAKFNVSFIELYNEEIRDLLTPGNSSGSGPGLDLREDPIKGPLVAGVTEVPTTSPEAVMRLVHTGNSRRRTEGTAANPVSSRSHAVLQVMCEQHKQSKDKKNRKMMQCSKLSLIDLAGSERAANTQNRGQRLVEGAKINRSLLALANCINALSKKGMYVNFRDSKLTRLLKDSLGGNTRTAMIAHVSPSSASFEESLNTLKWAHRARSITSEVRISWKPARERYGAELVDNMRQGTMRLKEQLQRTAPRESPSVGRYEGARVSRMEGTMPAVEESESEDLLNAIDDMAQTRVEVVNKLREQTILKQSMLELEDQNKRNRIEISKLQVSMLDKKKAIAKEERSESKNDDDAPVKKVSDKQTERNERRKRKARKEMQALKKAMHQNAEKKEELNSALKSQSEAIKESESKLLNLMSKVDQKTEEASAANSMVKKVQVRLADAQHEISSLEIQKLELEQAAVVQEGRMRERELALHKVQLQVQLRDRALSMLMGALSEHPSNMDVRKMLSELAQGPVEPIFTSLISELPAPRASVSADALDELEGNDDEGGEDDFKLINKTFKDLAISLKRTSNLDAMIEQEKNLAAEEGKHSDDDKSDLGESKYDDDDDDYDDDDDDDIDDFEDDEDYDEEFEAEPELASPDKNRNR